LAPGEANSGKLVTLVRREARRLAEEAGATWILDDGPPGIGCPVTAAVTGVDLALIVTEPTLSGIHDMQRVAALCRHFEVPALVCKGLILGRIDWPDIPGLRQVLEAQGLVAPASQAMEAVEPGPSVSGEKGSVEHDLKKALHAQPTLADKWARDPTGNSLALAVLAGMLFSVILLGYRAISPTARQTPWPRWSVPVLLTIALAVAAYLSFVEVSQVAAVCGPVGDCNAVQQSPYANLFGLIPMAVLGLAAYVTIGLAWVLQHFGPHRWRRLGALTTLGLTLGGTLFSIYLSFLEPFVIGATCLWCLTSAIVMTLMLWAVAGSSGQKSAASP
jgi:uncharacterized membrane protein